MEPSPPLPESDDTEQPTATGELLPATQTAAISAPTGGRFQAGELVAGRFRIKRTIAEGGMGVVYLAVDEKLKQLRALKVAKLGFAGQLPPEARSALAVTHPNVCRVFEIHTADTPDGPFDFLSMEFIDGGTLSRRLREKGAFPEPEARRLAEQICAGLAASHARNLLHRDLKSNNVLLAGEPGGGLRAVVTDFGLAQQPALPPIPSESSDPYVTGVAGTPEYLAPERWQGKPASVASDIYALG
ncbi:MAG: serine/threonine-protein kinase, partial [Acidobacteriota bacterium]